MFPAAEKKEYLHGKYIKLYFHIILLISFRKQSTEFVEFKCHKILNSILFQPDTYFSLMLTQHYHRYSFTTIPKGKVKKLLIKYSTKLLNIFFLFYFVWNFYYCCRRKTMSCSYRLLFVYAMTFSGIYTLKLRHASPSCNFFFHDHIFVAYRFFFFWT